MTENETYVCALYNALTFPTISRRVAREPDYRGREGGGGDSYARVDCTWLNHTSVK